MRAARRFRLPRLDGLIRVAAALAIAEMALAPTAHAQTEIGAMPIQVRPMEEYRETDEWFTVGVWQPAGARVAIEARHAEPDDSMETVASRLVARSLSDGDAPAAWVADAARVALHEWDSSRVTIGMRRLSGDRLAIVWVFTNPFDEDDGEGPSTFLEAAVLLGFDAASGGALRLEEWLSRTTTGVPTGAAVPPWLSEGLSDDVRSSIEAGALEEAERGITWLDWVGETRAARHLRTSWTRAHNEAESTRRETSIGEAIEAGRFDDAERELTALEGDRSARRVARTLRAALRDARAAWFDAFTVAGLHRGMGLSEARSVCFAAGGAWEVNRTGTMATCHLADVAGAVLRITGNVTVGLVFSDAVASALSVMWAPDTSSQLARLEAAVVRTLAALLGTGSNRSALHHGSASGSFWEVTPDRIVDQTSVTIPPELGASRPYLLTVSFRTER